MSILSAIILVCGIGFLVSGTRQIIQDTTPRIQWIHEGNSAMAQEASSHNIQLV